jgi:uncharacterized OB-fold protein
MPRPGFWRDREQNERFVASRCQECGYVSYSEHRQVCKECGATPSEWEEVQLQERGTVQAFVVQRRMPDEFETPLSLAVIDVPTADGDGAARVYGHFTETEPEDLEIGMEVEADLRRLFDVEGMPVRSYRFKTPRGGDD